MEISYENNIEDMVALTEHQISTSPAYHKRRRWNLYGNSLLILIAGAYLAHSAQNAS